MHFLRVIKSVSKPGDNGAEREGMKKREGTGLGLSMWKIHVSKGSLGHIQLHLPSIEQYTTHPKSCSSLLPLILPILPSCFGKSNYAPCILQAIQLRRGGPCCENGHKGKDTRASRQKSWEKEESNEQTNTFHSGCW